MNTDKDWTTDAVGMLRTLWAEGHTTAEIGRRMGLTKNAVIGKAHRLQLPKRPSPIRRGGTPRPRAPARVRRPTLPPLASVTNPTIPMPASASTRRPSVPSVERRTPVPTPIRPYAGASGKPCCWPLGEPGQPGFRFCEAGSAPGRPYCPEHADVAYVRPAAARERPDGPRLNRYLRTLTETA